jgi:archaemetzincin
MALLRLLPIYASGQTELLDPLSRRLEQIFELGVQVQNPGFDPEAAFDAGRGQYNSTLLLAQLLREPFDHGRILGVTGVDLFIPVLTYVFGEAQLDGRAALVSTHRLDPEGYGLPASRDLLMHRLVKEAVHELGHTYGLVHCERSSCVMSRSTYVEEIDLKGESFCNRCRDVVRKSPVR